LAILQKSKENDIAEMKYDSAVKRNETKFDD